MEFPIKSGSPETQRGACIVAGVYRSRRMSPAATALDKASGGLISNVMKRGDIDGKAGSTLMLHQVPNVACERVLLVGFGAERDLDAAAYRSGVKAAATALKKVRGSDAVSCLLELPVKNKNTVWKARQAATNMIDAHYTFDQMKGEKPARGKQLSKLAMLAPKSSDTAGARQGAAQGLAIGEGISLTKDLGNLPGNVCTPTYLAKVAKDMKRGNSKLTCKVIEEAEMEKLGMGALLSVSRGSEQPAKLIMLEYKGADSKSKPHVLVGKGITFDTGGISLKPGGAMDEMKFDMCGAATVLGVMSAINAMNLKLNVVGVVTSAENMPGGRATKPGDIVTTMSGQTVEILNTDAEGRLVLCDALTYVERYKPASVVDIATLTGACIIALGHHASGLLGNNDGLIKELLDSGVEAGDQAWQLPLLDDYQKQLKSNFADMANIGGRPAGTITAACFLSRFTEKYRWAHLDIAGTAWYSGERKGGTGRPVPLLVQYLMDKAGAA